MLGLFRIFHRRPAPVVARRTRLTLEALESRYCPAAPSITLTAVPTSGRMVQVSGTVTDENPETALVQLGGVLSGMLIPDSSGDFYGEVEASGLGTATAQAIDDELLASSLASASISSAVPTITLSMSPGIGRVVSLNGQVTDEDPLGVVVTFSGVVPGGSTVTPDATGYFSLDVEATGLGTITVQATDPWGQTSNTPSATVTSNAPEIVQFVAIPDQADMWTFRGKVIDESPEGLEVYFGGFPILDESTAIVGSDGWFELVVTLPPNATGTAEAWVADCWGLISDSALATVSS